MDLPALRSEKGGANMLQTLSSFEKYKKFLMTQEERGGIVRIYSSGVKMTLKVRIAPMETTPFPIVYRFPCFKNDNNSQFLFCSKNWARVIPGNYPRSSIHVYHFCLHVVHFCSTWMTSCMQFEKIEGWSFWTDISVKVL